MTSQRFLWIPKELISSYLPCSKGASAAEGLQDMEVMVGLHHKNMDNLSCDSEMSFLKILSHLAASPQPTLVFSLLPVWPLPPFYAALHPLPPATPKRNFKFVLHILFQKLSWLKGIFISQDSVSVENYCCLRQQYLFLVKQLQSTLQHSFYMFSCFMP